MQGRKAGIKSKYPEPFRRDIPFKWQPVRRLVFTVAVRKVHKKNRLQGKHPEQQLFSNLLAEACRTHFIRPKNAISLLEQREGS